jgi:aryl-alcohol dehydrogenase-like predicted oxidoreductase
MLAISRVGFGAWAAGGAAWSYAGGSERDERSLAAMRAAIDGGVDWVDTAPIYGDGHSEELVGRLLREAGHDRVRVFTKCGRVWDNPSTSPRSDLRPAAIRAGCEASLRRLGVDCIDVLQFHWPDHDTGTPVEESWGEMARLIDEGKIRAAGVCNFDVPLLERCERVGHVASLQTPISLIVRDGTQGLIQWCAAHDVAVLAYSPMQVGLLTDSFTAAIVERFEPDDWRRTHPEFLPPKLQRNLALRDRLRPIAEAHSTTVAAVAVAWVLSWPQVTGAIVGASSPEQVEGWIGAADLELTAADHDRIQQALAST